MFIFKQICWHIYLLIYLLFIIKRLAYFFIPGFEHHTYFHLLVEFDVYFHIDYYINMIQLLILSMHIIPNILFIYRIKFLPAAFWQFLFLSRVVLDVIGNSFEYNYLWSIWHVSRPMFTITLILSLATYVPSYIATLLYAFRNNENGED